MTVEIQSTVLSDGVVTIMAVDCSEEHLQYIERCRDDGVPKLLKFVFDTTSKKDYVCFRKWMKQQKAAKNAATWGEALNAVQGTVTDIQCRYRAWD